jgi:hypothetical protein
MLLVWTIFVVVGISLSVAAVDDLDECKLISANMKDLVYIVYNTSININNGF